jgi:hypothetical protein
MSSGCVAEKTKQKILKDSLYAIVVRETKKNALSCTKWIFFSNYIQSRPYIFLWFLNLQTIQDMSMFRPSLIQRIIIEISEVSNHWDFPMVV